MTPLITAILKEMALGRRDVIAMCETMPFLATEDLL